MAGLAAIQTAKNMGAVVLGYDVRPVVQEQVESMGGQFLKVRSRRPFTPSTRIVSRNDGDGWFLSRFWETDAPRRSRTKKMVPARAATRRRCPTSINKRSRPC